MSPWQRLVLDTILDTFMEHRPQKVFFFLLSHGLSRVKDWKVLKSDGPGGGGVGI